MSSPFKLIGPSSLLALAIAVIPVPSAGASAVQASGRSDPTAHLARHFDHEDRIYGTASGGTVSGDEIRAAALDKRYGNTWTRLSPAEFRSLVSAFGPEVMNTMTPQQARAELARGQGLNQLAEQYAMAAAEPTSSGQGTGFDWGDAGIGAAAAFGAMLLAAAGALLLRKRARLVLHS
jgi:hypothetical protein